MAFKLGSTEQELQAQRANTLREIEARGGKAKAPGYVERLNQIDSALRNLRQGGGAQGQNDGNPFNAQGYLSANPDVAREAERLQASGDRRTKEQIALDHWNSNGKAEGRSFVPTSTPPVNPTNDPAPMGPLPDKIETYQQGVEAEKVVADTVAKGQIAYGNAAKESTPFGEKTVEFDENGRPVIKETLTPQQQEILDQQQELSKTGGDAAKQIIEQGGLNKAFDPTLDDRVAQGDLMDWRRKQQEELEQYLTRNIDRDKARDLNELETRLYNRGIPLDRQAEAYDRAMEGLARDYDSRRADAAAQALKYGGEEAQRTFNMNEETRRNQMNEQVTTRGQNVNDVQTMSTLGTGVIVPQFNPFTGGTYDVNSPTEIELELRRAQEEAKRRKLEEQILKQQQNRGGGGGGTAPSGNSGTVAQSPFVD
jgi:hypothetical protein